MERCPAAWGGEDLQPYFFGIMSMLVNPTPSSFSRWNDASPPGGVQMEHASRREGCTLTHFDCVVITLVSPESSSAIYPRRESGRRPRLALLLKGSPNQADALIN